MWWKKRRGRGCGCGWEHCEDNEPCERGLRFEVGEQIVSYMNVLAWGVSRSWADMYLMRASKDVSHVSRGWIWLCQKLGRARGRCKNGVCKRLDVLRANVGIGMPCLLHSLASFEM